MLRRQEFVTQERATTVQAGNTLSVGRQLKVDRVTAGVSLTRVAMAVGISAGHLSHIEADRRKASPELLERIRTAVRAAA